jgi:cytoskeletal protein RodZ
MSELARTFRDARKAQNFSLDEAERGTKIRRRYLEAIEAGDFDQLPDGPPARGFIKNYARFLALDGHQAIADFEAEVGVPAIYAREHIPPPPNHSRQRRRSSYTQLEAPKLHYKGRLPAPEDADLDNYSDGGANGMGNTYNLGFEDADRVGDPDDEMARYRPRNYPAPNNLEDGDEDGQGGRRVLQPRRSKLRAGKSSFRLSGRSVPNNGFALSEGVPEISTVLPTRQRSRNQRARPVATFQLPNVQLPNIKLPKELPMALGGALVIGLLAAFVGLVIVPAMRASSFFSSRSATPASAAASGAKPAISITIIAPNKGAVSTQSNPTTAAQPQAPAVPVRTDGLQIALDAREQAWVRVKVDGNVVYEGMPAIGPTVPWNAKSKISLETGNAGAFDVIVNGVRVGPLGARNTVARKVWDLSGQAKDGE